MRLFGLFLISLFLRAPWPVKILVSLIFLPIVVPLAILRIRRHRKEQAPVHRLPPEVLTERLVLQTAELDPGHKETEAFKARVLSLVDAGDWAGLDTLVTRCDQNRMTAKDDTRLAPLAIVAIWDRIFTRAEVQAEDCLSKGEDAIPASAIEPFLDAADQAPDSYALTAIAAGLAMQLGWARRGHAWSDLTEEDALRAMQGLFDTAGGLLSAFDASELNSPLLAGLAYDHLAGIGTSLGDLKKAFALRMRQDPHDPEALAAQGWYLLPRWYGDYEQLDDTARRRHAATHKDRGAADYTLVYDQALTRDEGAMMMVDLGLYRDGLYDLIDRSRDPEATVNLVLNTLHEVGLPRVGLGGSLEPKELAERRAWFRALFDEIARARLTLILPHRWGDGLDAARHSLALTYQAEILAGETVHVGEDLAA